MKFFTIIFFFCIQITSIYGETIPLISIITPTYNREDRLPNLYNAFCSQTYENKELLVLDDSPQTSTFFSELKDPRVKYWHITSRMSVGGKRNWLIEKASGEIIAQFDDDDYYAPCYLAKMIETLSDADFIKLSTWLIWRENDKTLWEWDTRKVDTIHFQVTGNSQMIVKIDPKKIELDRQDNYTKNLWGYGFSYMFRKSLWQQAPFEDINFAEDYKFFEKAQSNGRKVLHIPDSQHMVLHTLHKQSSSCVYPQKQIDTSLALELLGPEAKPWLDK
jgi:glycosyltransferase involved in cell wall biosynthesis